MARQKEEERKEEKERCIDEGKYGEKGTEVETERGRTGEEQKSFNVRRCEGVRESGRV